MKIENQVCSLELAKKLKELGVKQDSLLWWAEEKKIEKDKRGKWRTVDKGIVPGHYNYRDESFIDTEHYSAFTVAELGSMLPDIYKITLSKYKYKGIMEINVGLWELDKEWGKERNVNTFRAKTEANGRAECLIHLLENKLIDQRKLNYD